RVGEAGGTQESRVELAEGACPLHLARDVERHQAMRIGLPKRRIVTAVGYLVVGWIEAVEALDRIAAKLRRRSIRDAVGVAQWHQAAIGDERDRGLPQI